MREQHSALQPSSPQRSDHKQDSRCRAQRHDWARRQRRRASFGPNSRPLARLSGCVGNNGISSAPATTATNSSGPYGPRSCMRSCKQTQLPDTRAPSGSRTYYAPRAVVCVRTSCTHKPVGTAFPRTGPLISLCSCGGTHTCMWGLERVTDVQAGARQQGQHAGGHGFRACTLGRKQRERAKRCGPSHALQHTPTGARHTCWVCTRTRQRCLLTWTCAADYWISTNKHMLTCRAHRAPLQFSSQPAVTVRSPLEQGAGRTHSRAALSSARHAAPPLVRRVCRTGLQRERGVAL